MSTDATPRIALCIPAYNAARTLPRLFESVRAQTRSFDSVWVYDDASTDDSAEIAASFGANVVRGVRNVGCSGGKNALLERVGTEWVHFFDADDTLHPQFVERSHARIAQGAADALLFDYEQCDESSGRILACCLLGQTLLEQDPIQFMLTHTINNVGVYSTDQLRRAGGFDTDPAVRYNEDRAFHLRLAESGARFAAVGYLGCRLYYNPNSMSAANQLNCTRAHQEITRRFAERHPDRYLRDIADVSWANAGRLASHQAWAEADACVALARRAYGRFPPDAGPLFTALCAIDGALALRVRETLIRVLKPGMRRRTDKASA